jgi:hypothetical protein
MEIFRRGIMKVRLSVFIERLFMASGPRAHYRTGQVLRKLSLLFCCLILLCPLALPQEISGSYSVERNEAQVSHLLGLLRPIGMKGAIECFFGKDVIYDKYLADLLVFVDTTQPAGKPTPDKPCLQSDNSVQFSLFKGHKKRTDLFGEKFLYLMVFIADKASDPDRSGTTPPEKEPSRTIKVAVPENSEKPATITEEKCEKATQKSGISIRQSSLDYTVGSGEFFLVSMIKSILKAIPGGTSVDTSSKTEAIKEVQDAPLKMDLVGCTEDKYTRLYFGYMRLSLVENTINRYTVVEARSENEKYYHLATLGNYCSSYFGSSIGFTGTFMTASQRLELSDKRLPINAFFFGHLYLKRPRLPSPHSLNGTTVSRLVRRFSFSLVCGTALKVNLLDDLFVGVGIGHLYSTLGLVIGCNFRTEPNKLQRKPHLCLGLTFAL